MDENIRGKNVRLRDEVSGDILETIYTVIMEEEDNEIPDLVWIYLESEYEDENIEYEPKFDIYYSRITNNFEGLIVL